MAIRSALTKFLSSRCFRFPFPGRIQTNEAHCSAFLPKKLLLRKQSAEQKNQQKCLAAVSAEASSQQKPEFRTVRIKGVPLSATEEDVRRFFGDCSPSIMGVNFTYSKRGRFSGAAYVEFSDANTCKEAFKKNNNTMDSHVEIFPLGESEHERVKKLLGKRKETKSRKETECVVRIRGIPSSATEEDVRNFFGDSAASIVAVNFEYNWKGQYKRVAKVEFSDANSNKEALKKNGNLGIIGFKAIKMKLSDAASSGAVVKIRGLPLESTEDDVRSFFRQEETGLEVVNVHSHGEAFVQFVDHPMAEKALKKHMDYMGDRYIKVVRSSLEGMNLTADQAFGRMAERDPEGQLSSLRKQIKSGAESVVRIKGLPWSATEEDVRNFLGDCAASIVAVIFAFDRIGRFLGEAYVEFSDANSCKEALKMKRRDGHIRIIALRESGLDKVNKLLIGASEGVVVKMLGLPFGYTEDDIRSFFHGLEVVSVHSHGQAFVQLVDQGMVDQALRKHKEHVGDRRIQLFRSSREQLDWVAGKGKGQEPMLESGICPEPTE